MGASEFRDWQTFYELEPFGDVRADLRAGIVAATVANAHRDPRKGKPARPQDYMLQFEPKPPRTAQSMYEQMKALVMATGGKIIKRQQ